MLRRKAAKLAATSRAATITAAAISAAQKIAAASRVVSNRVVPRNAALTIALRKLPVMPVHHLPPVRLKNPSFFLASL
jgi:hypothetical protein